MLTSTFPRRPDDDEPGFVHALCQHLAANFDITVLVPHAPKLLIEEKWDKLTVKRFRYAPSALETLAYNNGMLPQLRAHPWKTLLVPAFLFSQWLAAIKLIRSGSFDIVHAHWLFPQGFTSVFLGNIPVVVTSHGSDLNSLKGRLFRLTLRHVLGRARIVTTVSASLANSARALQPKILDLRILPMGVDLQGRFTPGTVQREPATFLFVGRLIAKKGLDSVLEAFASLMPDFPHAKLTVIGSGPEAAHYLAQAKSLSIEQNTEFLGALPPAQLPYWFQKATALVSDSHAEGLGLVFIEAAGCGCPVIAPDLPVIREILVDGESAILSPPRSSKHLAAAMRRILGAPADASRLGEAARKRVLSRYDWTSTAEGYAKVLVDAAQRSPK